MSCVALALVAASGCRDARPVPSKPAEGSGWIAAEDADAARAAAPLTAPDASETEAPREVVQDADEGPRRRSVSTRWRGQAPAGRNVALFGLDLHRAVLTDPERRHRSVAFSPLSIAGALSMATMGARGATGDELARAIRLPKTMPPGAYLELEKGAALAMNRADRVYVDPTTHLEPSYAARAGGMIAWAPFHDQPDRARREINGWVARETKGGVPSLLPEGAVSELTRLVLVDAMAAAARWKPTLTVGESPFQVFHGRGGESSSVPMMSTVHPLRVTADASYEAVELPCADGEHALLVVMPSETTFDAFVPSARAYDAIVGALESAEPEPTALTLPRFSIAGALPLGSLLQALGVRSAFHPDSADFSALTPAKGVFISGVFHSATIDVDEKGVKMTAATATVVSLPGPRPTIRSIRIDRPFYFWLRNLETDAPLVTGRYMGPGR